MSHNPGDFNGLCPRPVYRTYPVNPKTRELELLHGSEFPPDNIRRSLIRGLLIHPVNQTMDAFDALTAPLYLDGVLSVEDANSHTSTHQEMVLELRLNLAAFLPVIISLFLLQFFIGCMGEMGAG